MNIIAQIVTGAVKLWDTIEADINADAAKVKEALPASAAPDLAATVSDLKQGASDALGTVGTALAGAAPDLATGLETLADNAMASLTNGMSLPLVPMVNAGIDNVVSMGTAVLAAWALKEKASLATGKVPTPAPPAPQAE